MSQVTPMRFPFVHHYDIYPRSVSTMDFRAFLKQWYAVGDVLKKLPAGTCARLAPEAGWLVMAPIQDQLYLLWATDLRGPALHHYLYAPHDWLHLKAPSSVQDLREQTQYLTDWLANPVYDAPLDPEVISTTVFTVYRAASPAIWAWDGSLSAKGHFTTDRQPFFTPEEFGLLLDVVEQPAQREALRLEALASLTPVPPREPSFLSDIGFARIHPLPLPYYPKQVPTGEGEQSKLLGKVMKQWNLVADILKRQPPGTVARLDGTSLVMVARGDGLVMCITKSDLSLAPFDKIELVTLENTLAYGDVSSLEAFRKELKGWRKSPVYAAPVCPVKLVEICRNTFNEESVSHWCWNGKEDEASRPQWSASVLLYCVQLRLGDNRGELATETIGKLEALRERLKDMTPPYWRLYGSSNAQAAA